MKQLFNGELYTILITKQQKGKKGTIVAMIAGTKAQTVIILNSKLRNTVSDNT
jgi:riboflavin transporter FmnP